MTGQGENEEGERSPFDFSPFDGQANLDALCDIIRTIRHLSWSYAGDIYRTVKRIAQTFDAGRCVIFVSTDSSDGNRIDVFEHVEPPLEPLHGFFEGSDGQKLLTAFLESGKDWIDSPAFAEVVQAQGIEIPSGLLEPVTYVFPLRNQHASRHASKPGLLLMQEPHGLARWNRRLIDSLVVVTEYLAMVIECERLSSAAARELGTVGGVLTPHKFREYGNREIMRGKELECVISLVVLGIPVADSHRPSIAQMKAGFMPGLAAQLVEYVSAFDLVSQWSDEMVVVLLQASDVEEAVALAREAQRLGAGWLIQHQLSLDASMSLPAAAISCYPQHGDNLQVLIEKTLHTFESCVGNQEGSVRITG